MATARKPSVLLIENEHAIAEIVAGVLAEAGFAVSILADAEPEAIRIAVG